MTIGTGNFPELLWPGLADLFGHDYKDHPTLYTKVFTIKKATKAFEKLQQVSRLGLAGIKSQGESVDYTDPQAGFQKEFIMVVYGLGTTITREMVDDEQYDYIRGAPSWLARSLRHTEETTAWSVLNNGYNAAQAYQGADGLALFSAAHIRPPGGIYSNTITAAADLTQTSLEAMLQQIEEATDDHGLQIRITPKTLICAPANDFRANKLMSSAKVIGSADNDPNLIPGRLSDLVISPWLTDTDAWYIGTDVEGLVFFRRWATEISRDNEFDTENLKIKALGRWDVNHYNPRAIWGSQGV